MLECAPEDPILIQVEGPPLNDPQRPGHGEPGEPDPFTGSTGRLLVWLDEFSFVLAVV